MKDLLKIFVCHHKDGFILKNDIYEPIQSGRKTSNIKLNIVGDDTGENISIKNENYAELDVLYWIWKNKKYLNINYVGLCHHRRYFDLYNNYNNYKEKLNGYIKNKIRKYSINSEIINFIIPYLRNLRLISQSFYGVPLEINLEIFKQTISSKSPTFKDSLINYDVIIPRKEFLGKYTIDTQYRITHLSEDFKVLKEVLIEKYIKYLDLLIEFFNLHFLSFFNMFIMKREIFNQYCEWLFDILFEVEKRIHISKYERQKKVFAYMGERLLNLFLYLNNGKFRVKEIPIFFIKDLS